MADRVVKVILRGDVSGLKASMTAASKSVADAADRMTDATKESAKFRQGLTSVGDTAGKMGLAAAAGLGMVSKAAMDWESAWAGVTKTVDGSASQMATLEGELRGLAKTLPASHQEIAAVAEAAGQLGVQREGITAFTKTMIDLSETTNLTADEAATSIAQMANVMRTAPDEIDNLGASLVAVGNAGASTEAQIIQMSQGISGAAAVVGLAEADVLGIANAVASIGIEVEAGGSAISRVLTSMAKSVAEGGDMLAEFASAAGMSAEDFATAFEDRPAEAFTAFIEGLGRIQEQGGNVFGTLDRLGMEDVRVSRALLGMAADSDKFAGSLELANQAWGENTALAEEAEKRYETTGARAQVAWNNIVDSAIEFGDVALPAIAAGADKLADFASAVGDLPGPVKTATTGLLGITAVLGGGMWFTAKTINGVAEMRRTLDDLGPVAGKAGRALAGLGVAATAIYATNRALDALEQASRDSLPSVDALTNSLLNLRDAEVARALAGDLGDVGAALDRITDPGLRARGFDWMHDAGKQMSSLASGAEWLAGKMGGFGEEIALSSAEAEASIAALDEAMANIAASGSPERAAQAFEDLAEAQGLTAEEQDALLDRMPLYADALKGVENASELAASGTDDLTGSTADLGAEAGGAASEIDDLVDAMREQRSEALRAANAEIDYQAALDDARKSIKDNGRTLDITTEKGRANMRALNDVAGSWNNLSAEAKEAPGAYASARKAFIDLAMGMGASRKEAQGLARELMELPARKTVEVEVNTAAARAGLESFIASASGRVISIGTRVVNTSPNRIARASGGPVFGPGTATSDSIPAWLSNGEFVMNAKAVRRYGLDTMHAMNAMRLAAGGPVGMARGGNVDDRLDLLRLQQQINELRRDLGATGKDQIKGLARAIAEAELEAAKRDLRQARRAPSIERRDALRSVELDIEGGASVEDTREALREFRRDVKEAGGTWTKALANQSHRLIDLAKRQERAAGNLERETELRDRIAEKLADEIRALEDVKSAMASFSSSVAGNFLTDPFGGGGAVSGSVSGPVNSPELSAARAALAGAEGRYRDVLASGGDRLQRSYQASRALAEAQEYRSQVEELERAAESQIQATERTVSGIDAFRETLLRDTAAANEHVDALRRLVDVIDEDWFRELSLSGNSGLAAEFAGLDRGTLAELNLLWQEREAAAAQVATFATQQAFGAQLDAATRAVEMTEKTLARQDRTIATLNNRLENLGNRVEAGAERGVASLGRQIQAIQTAINNIPRQTAAEKRKAGKR